MRSIPRRPAVFTVVLLVVALAATPFNGVAGGPPGEVIEGVLTRVKGDDFAAGRSVAHGYVLASKDKLIRLAFADKPADKLVGKKVRLKGRQGGETFNVAAGGTQATTTSPSSSAVANGVTVRIAPAYSSRTQSKLVDTTPSATSFSDAALAAGRTFTDPLTGVSVTMVPRLNVRRRPPRRPTPSRRRHRPISR